MLRMEANEEFGLEEVVITSNLPDKLNACLKMGIRDLQFKDMPDKYYNCSMARVHDSQYLMNVRSGCYVVDVDSLKATNIGIYIGMYNFTNCFIDGESMLIVGYYRWIAILRDLKYIGKIDLDIIHESCKNGLTIHGRYSQQVGNTVYAVDRHGRLYRIEWQDIKEGKYQKTLVKPHVQNFYVDIELGVCTVKNDTLYLESGTVVNLRNEAYYYENWTIVTCVAKCWIVSGDRNHFGDCNIVHDVTMARISKRGKVISRLKIKQTYNGYKDIFGKKYGGIYALQKV